MDIHKNAHLTLHGRERLAAKAIASFKTGPDIAGATRCRSPV